VSDALSVQDLSCTICVAGFHDVCSGYAMHAFSIWRLTGQISLLGVAYIPLHCTTDFNLLLFKFT
jgi:hypothetical protein